MSSVTIGSDVSVGFNFHVQAAQPSETPVPRPALEMFSAMSTAAGSALDLNQLTSSVDHASEPIVLGDHDVGPFTLDVTFPAVNLWYSMIWPRASRRTAFSAGSVTMDGAPAAAATALPMMTCGDVATLPSAFSLLSWMNTVDVGMSAADIASGCVNIGASVAIDLMFYESGAEPGESSADERMKQFMKQLVPFGDWKKLVFGELAGLCVSTLSASITAEPRRWSLGPGAPYAQIQGNVAKEWVLPGSVPLANPGYSAKAIPAFGPLLNPPGSP